MTGLSFTYESTARTHVGCVRELNEDAYVDRPLIGLWAVADGMGGHHAGEVASGLIAESLNEVHLISSGYGFLDDVRSSLERVNNTLVARAGSLEPKAVIGSTVVAILAYGGHFACLWAGDSRAYLMRRGELRRVSRDHSMVQELIDAGNLSQEDARTYKRSNVITRAVGVYENFQTEMVQGVIEAGDVFLLCSDGLTGMVEDEEIARLLAEADLDLAADRMIQMCLDRGAKDNVTVVLIRASESPDDTVSQVRVPGWGA